jgi:hypothetical protein
MKGVSTRDVNEWVQQGIPRARAVGTVAIPVAECDAPEVTRRQSTGSQGGGDRGRGER